MDMIDKEWCLRMAKLEDGHEIGAGLLAIDPVFCEHCDGTGDVHRADGEWLGTCDCAALSTPPEPVGREK